MRHFFQFIFAFTLILCFSLEPSFASSGNQTISSFTQAKKHLRNIYADHMQTFYCSASYLDNGTVIHPEGFDSSKFTKRSKKIEWEHIVPAENFGRGFSEWREGHIECVDKKGKPFKGRKCAEKMNKEFRLMLSDMYNLVPAIGSVNALRSNFQFTEMHPTVKSSFGTCLLKVFDKMVEPPEHTKGAIARTYFYIEMVYPSFKISDKMRKVLRVWDKRHPVDRWECERTKRIKEIQKNSNPIVEKQCQLNGFM